MSRKVKVGVVGCGNISSIYFENLTQVFLNVEVFACCDLDKTRVEEAAEKWGIPNIMTLDEILECNEIEIILNLTTPQTHYSICKKALEAGKNVYVEKPLSLSFEEGRELVELAKSKNLLLGGAPDTFMGAGIQTCKKLIEDGYIGEPLAATAFMMCRGHESWHPDPEFYYKKGGGPMFDMGPYYLTALVNLMGGVSEVCSMGRKSFDERTITSEKKYGNKVEVEVDTHIAGLLRFNSNAIGTIITSFDVLDAHLPCIEVYGSRGTLLVPDPNTFGGPVKLLTMDGEGFKEIPLTHIYAENSRGIGVSDMAKCILNGGKNLASADLTCHILEIMTAFEKSDKAKEYYKMETKLGRVESLSSDLIKGEV